LRFFICTPKNIGSRKILFQLRVEIAMAICYQGRKYWTGGRMWIKFLYVLLTC